MLWRDSTGVRTARRKRLSQRHDEPRDLSGPFVGAEQKILGGRTLPIMEAGATTRRFVGGLRR